MTTEEAWTRYKQMNDPTAKQHLVITYTKLIHFALGRIHVTLNPLLQIEDALSYGMIGLLDAINKYDPARGFKFETYAVPRIQGAIFDGIRETQWLPRSIQDKMSLAERAVERLTKQLGRAPDHDEVAQTLGMEIGTYQAMIRKIRPVAILSLDDTAYESHGGKSIPFEETIADPGALDPHDHVAFATIKHLLTEAIETLPEREKLVVTLYVYEELTLKEIGAILGISESRVCQLYTQALKRMREYLGVDRPKNIYYSDNESRSRKNHKGGRRMTQVIVDDNTKRVYDLLAKLASAKDRTVDEPEGVLTAARLDPHAMEVLRRQGALERVGIDKWKVVDGVEFDVVESLPPGLVELPITLPVVTGRQEKKEEESGMAPVNVESGPVKLGQTLAKSYQQIRQFAEVSDDYGLVIPSSRLTTLSVVKPWHVTGLKDKGLLEQVGRDPQDKRGVLWKVKVADIEEVAALGRAEKAEPPAPVPEKPAKRQPAKKEKISKPVAKRAAKTEEKTPLSIGDALFQGLILDHGQLRPAEELRQTAAILDKVARLAETIAEAPEGFQTFMEFSKILR